MRKEWETNSQSELFVTVVVVEWVLCVCERKSRQQFGQVMLQIQRVGLTVFVFVIWWFFCADQLFKLQLFTVCVSVLLLISLVDERRASLHCIFKLLARDNKNIIWLVRRSRTSGTNEIINDKVTNENCFVKIEPTRGWWKWRWWSIWRRPYNELMLSGGEGERKGRENGEPCSKQWN